MLAVRPAPQRSVLSNSSNARGLQSTMKSESQEQAHAATNADVYVVAGQLTAQEHEQHCLLQFTSKEGVQVWGGSPRGISEAFKAIKA